MEDATSIVSLFVIAIFLVLMTAVLAGGMITRK